MPLSGNEATEDLECGRASAERERCTAEQGRTRARFGLGSHLSRLRLERGSLSAWRVEVATYTAYDSRLT